MRSREEKQAKLICDGRDIEYRELEITFNKENHVWDLISDSLENPEILLDKTIVFLSAYIKEHLSFVGTPSELAEKLQPLTEEKIVPNVLSKKLYQNAEKLEQMGILFNSKRSNSKRIIEIEYCKSSASSDDSDDKNDIPPHILNLSSLLTKSSLSTLFVSRV